MGNFIKSSLEWLAKWSKGERPEVAKVIIRGERETSYLLEVIYKDETETIERVEKNSERYKELEKWIQK